MIDDQFWFFLCDANDNDLSECDFLSRASQTKVHFNFKNISHLLISELLSQVGHHVPEFSSRDEAVSIFVKDTECLPDLLLAVCVLHLPGHHGEELWEVDGAVAIGVDLVDHVLQLRLCRVLSQRPHHRAELLGGDGAVPILVEEGERLLELSNLP